MIILFGENTGFRPECTNSACIKKWNKEVMAEIIFFLYKTQNGVKALQKANYKISHSDELNDDLRIHQATKKTPTETYYLLHLITKRTEFSSLASTIQSKYKSSL